MSNSLAIAAVTSTVRFVLDRALQAPHPGAVGNTRVTTLRPDRLSVSDLVHPAGINVFLYQVTPNHAWNLSDLPTRGDDGSYLRRPVCALDLHYLITSYGEGPSLDAQRLLGRTVTALARTPVLTPAVVRAAMAAYGDAVETTFLKEADLVDQIESVKVTAASQSLEELSRLWSMFTQTPYELSLAYTATVVLLEAEVNTTTALPARQRVFAVSPAGRPRLSSAGPALGAGPAAAGGELSLRGSNLLGPLTKVRVGPALLAPLPRATAAALTVRLDDTVPSGLHSVQVVHLSRPGPDGRPPTRVVASSEALAVAVRPTVARATADADHITVIVNPPLAAGQRATVLLSRTGGESDAYSFVLPPPAQGAPPQPSFEMSREGVPQGQWLVRVQVDGVESIPELVGEAYGAPSVTLPPS
ncbi:DUF4255 domain-containing protein [Streptomyces sp. NPDC007808]|uniref:DUF4255 domain-containing protein n=1 Tax=Streptomyces sp. NPDC007808 TaxID=3364779 RepID=UPI0036BE68C5